jgi:hypothetical protein
MLRNGKWYARREVKAGKAEPANFEPLATDPETGKTVGWEPVEQSGFAKWHAEALAGDDGSSEDGTYELCGPKVNGNPEGFGRHVLIRHADAEQLQPLGERATGDIVATVLAHGWEGIVWHHPDGRMVKLKRRDIPAVAPQAEGKGIPSFLSGHNPKGQ